MSKRKKMIEENNNKIYDKVVAELGDFIQGDGKDMIIAGYSLTLVFASKDPDGNVAAMGLTSAHKPEGFPKTDFMQTVNKSMFDDIKEDIIKPVIIGLN